MLIVLEAFASYHHKRSGCFAPPALTEMCPLEHSALHTSWHSQYNVIGRCLTTEPNKSYRILSHRPNCISMWDDPEIQQHSQTVSLKSYLQHECHQQEADNVAMSTGHWALDDALNTAPSLLLFLSKLWASCLRFGQTCSLQ